jgi:formylglycine-generating enzyme required for sulfatase activity
MDDQGAMTSATFTFDVYLSNDWITIPAGNFLMGCATLDPVCGFFPQEAPLHTVNVPLYEIQKYEVTTYQYKKCVDAGACTVPQDLSNFYEPDYFGNSVYADYPVIMLDWTQASTYCNWIGARLPSEAEWEKSARGSSPSENIYPWGDASPDCSLADAAGCAAVSPNVYMVGNYPLGASVYGVMDMSANAWEWVEDDWHTDYTGAPTDGSAWIDGPRSGERVLRSGNNASNFGIRASYRQSGLINQFSATQGVRCAR